MVVTIPTHWIIVFIVGVVIYFLEVLLPRWTDKTIEADLKAAEEAMYKHRESVKKEQAEIIEKNKELKKAVATIVTESAKDKAEAKKKEEDIRTGKTSIKHFLESEGFDVEEIFPE